MEKDFHFEIKTHHSRKDKYTEEWINRNGFAMRVIIKFEKKSLEIAIALNVLHKSANV